MTAEATLRLDIVSAEREIFSGQAGGIVTFMCKLLHSTIYFSGCI